MSAGSGNPLQAGGDPQREAGSGAAQGALPHGAATVLQPYDPAAERGILVVLPHPDDESFAAGGTLARAAQAGVRTTYLCGTYGDMGRRMGRPAFTNREALRDVRTAELKDACQILGCEVRFLGLRDKCVEFEDPDEVAAKVRAAIDELRPSAVITFYPGYGVHPDHDALGHATVLAVRALPAQGRPRILAAAVGEREQVLAELGQPHLVCDIEAVSERKLDALRAHRSQTEVMFAQWGEKGIEGAQDEQSRAFREGFIKRERYYLLDADAPTLLERRA